MLTVAIIADKEVPLGKELAACLKDAGFKWIMGNTIDDFGGAEKLKEVDVIVPAAFANGNIPLLTDLWPLCPKVRWVHSLAAGVETVVPQMMALPGAAGVPLTNAKGAFSRSLAEYALAAMLHFNKQISRLQNQKANQTWQKFMMAELYGKTVGFVGFGDIAQTTVPYCKAFGMRVLALRQSSNGKGNDLADKVYYCGGMCAPTEDNQKLEIFKEADYIVCSLPGGAGTKHFCGREEFAAMKQTAVFISIGRGTCVDEVALAEALVQGRIGGAALDVFEKEPLPQDSPLWALDGLLMSPHNADLTDTYMQLTVDLFLSKIAAFSAADFKGFDVQVDKVKGY